MVAVVASGVLAPGCGDDPAAATSATSATSADSPSAASGPPPAEERPTPWAPQTEEAVIAAFTAYREAIVAGRGEEAAGMLSRTTLKTYDFGRESAIGRGWDSLERASIAELFLVGTLRLNFSLAELQAMDGRAVAAAAVDRGWIGQDAANERITDIELHRAYATAAAVVDDEPGPRVWQFISEEGEWRIDLDIALNAAAMAMHGMQVRSGLSRLEFIEAVLRETTGAPVPADLWTPLDER